MLNEYCIHLTVSVIKLLITKHGLLFTLINKTNCGYVIYNFKVIIIMYINRSIK